MLTAHFGGRCRHRKRVMVQSLFLDSKRKLIALPVGRLFPMPLSDRLYRQTLDTSYSGEHDRSFWFCLSTDELITLVDAN